MKRYFDVDFWIADSVDELSTNARIVYLYLILGPLTVLSGVAPAKLPMYRLATGLDAAAILTALAELEAADRIMWDRDTKEILVKRFYKHNWLPSDTTRRCVVNHAAAVHSDKIRAILQQTIDAYDWGKGAKQDAKKPAKGPEPKTEACEDKATAAFEEWWKAYPAYGTRKSAKQQCAKKYLAAIKDGATPEKMLQVLASQKSSPDWTKDDGAYTPAPLTYLNQRRWDVDIAEDTQERLDDADMPLY